MATNTLNGINLAAIAMDSLDFLGHTFFPLSLVSRDFSTDIAEKGESVTTRIISSYTAQDLTTGYASNAQNSTSTAVTVTLNKFEGVPVEFKDLEITKAGDLNWLRDQFVTPALDAVLDAVMQSIFTTCTTANFTNETDSTPGNFDADDLADIKGKLTKLKVPLRERSAILHPDFYTNVSKGSTVEDASAFGDNNAIKEGILTRVRGFNCVEYANIPAQGTENFRGMCMHPSAIALAARTIADPTDENLGAPLAVQNVKDPATGFPLQYRFWYSPNDGKAYFSIASLWGVKKGQHDSMHRLVDNS